MSFIASSKAASIRPVLLDLSQPANQLPLPPDLACDVAAWREISAETAPDALMFPSERGTFTVA
jgi:hypothetical protein